MVWTGLCIWRDTWKYHRMGGIACICSAFCRLYMDMCAFRQDTEKRCAQAMGTADAACFLCAACFYVCRKHQIA